ncbi:MAG: tRNA (adenosine(37)-N6)-threonylcarbamoyltransferase complex transferase subunit TsaD [Ignavibacteria bacterium]|jgi:N6-L-threonylcarbamoyladenine synthase|nr:tRNA (adenosine(37)-N6)-threonylcarbamoyltransferase complex transferase subunit TsaD [Ignavibacteria bacterium]MDH7528773.1 tRNA (adenosine(37)-N6)-threonylcarbamoyltransferase complex transferase subunit TsaD [Ignavibacteria bacterium]
MIVLGIETSCDETSIGIIQDNRIITNEIYSQKIHSEFGGVVPEIASRAHLQKILPLLKDALKSASIDLNDIDLIAATAGPGLIGALIVGYCFANGLSLSLNIPFVPVNHIDGHLYSVFLENPDINFPYIALLVSGGNTALYLIEDFYQVKLLGNTIDDAAGEAFDKVGKLLGLKYPAGADIEKLANEGDENFHNFPIAELNGKYDFSFSGLKTSVLRFIEKNYPGGIGEVSKKNIAASFQKAVIEALMKKTIAAVEEFNVKNVAVVGGVASNKYLQKQLSEKLPSGTKLFVPSPKLCTDNGAMIAFAGLKSYQTNYYLQSKITQPFPN